MVERLLEDPEDVLHFDDKTLNFRLLHNMIVSTGTATTVTETNKSIMEHYWLKCK